MASRREDGLIHVELVAHEAGTGWLANEVARLARTHGALDVLADPRTPAGTALPALEDHGVKVTEVNSGGVTTAYAMFVTACAEGHLRHIGQPELTAALTGAVRRPVGDAYAWSRRSSAVDISPLCAVTLAVWGVLARPGAPQVWSAYRSRPKDAPRRATPRRFWPTTPAGSALRSPGTDPAGQLLLNQKGIHETHDFYGPYEATTASADPNRDDPAVANGAARQPRHPGRRDRLPPSGNQVNRGRQAGTPAPRDSSQLANAMLRAGLLDTRDGQERRPPPP